MILAVTYGLFVALVSVAVLEVGFQIIVCGGAGVSCDGFGDVHGAYLGIVVVPTAVISLGMTSRWNVGRMRLQNADADWVKKQAGTK